MLIRLILLLFFIQPSFLEVHEVAPPPYTPTGTMTGKTDATASSYEMEEDDMFDFKFDDAQTQPYLSLGALTPLSQLTPPDTTPRGNDSYFFPSMPPPVTPISSVFSMNNSSGPAQGIPVDSPFQIGSGGMVMPEANPVAGEVSTSARRSGRRGKHEVSAHSQGYAMKLEPVMEQSCSLDDSARDIFVNPNTKIYNGVDSSSSSAEDPANSLLAPPDSRLPAHLRRKTAKRRKSGTRRKMDEEVWGDNELTVFGNKGANNSLDIPVKLSVESSPRQEGRRLRQEVREQELARQKDKLRLLHLEEEKARLLRQEQRAAHDYGSTRQKEQREQLSSPVGAGLVMEQAMKFEAQAQLDADSSPNRTSQPKNAITSISNQFSVL